MESNQTLPRDGKVMESIIKASGVEDFDPRVINQMLELTYRYVTQLLDEAKTMSRHARKKTIDVEDVRLGCAMLRARTETRPPARLLLSQLAVSKNKTCLPLPPVRQGMRLPPDRFCLTAGNFRLRKKRKVALVKNCSVISSGPEKEAPSPPQAEETPVFTIQYDLDQSHGFTLTNYFGQNMQ